MSFSKAFDVTYCSNHRSPVHFQKEILSIISVMEKAHQVNSIPPPYGLGLWLSEKQGSELSVSEASAALKEALKRHEAYVFTVNGFPYNIFHGEKVKSKVYTPDWSDKRRKIHSVRLAGVLAALMPDACHEGSINTVPVTYRPWATENKIMKSVQAISDTAVDLLHLENKTGKKIRLALEPEPGCLLEDEETTVRFFNDYLFFHGSRYLSLKHKITKQYAEDTLRDHTGVCLDTAHTAVTFEDTGRMIQGLASQGIRIPKIQISACPSVKNSIGFPGELEAFDEPVYLHQTSVKTAGGIFRFEDIPQAKKQGRRLRGEWRIHFHYPLKLKPSEGFLTTAGEINSGLLRTALNAGIKHFELEIYTLDLIQGISDVDACLEKDLTYLVNALKSAGEKTGNAYGKEG